MKIAVVGYGKMGKLIRSGALALGHEVVAVIDPVCPLPEVTDTHLDASTLNGCSVAIDFTHPSVVVDNIVLYARLGIPAVIGTTGWYDQVASIREAIDESSASIIYSGNFSLGVALFFQVAKYASRLFGKTGLYDPFIQEIHHAQKADSPSGTSVMLSQMVLENTPTKDSVFSDTLHRRREDGEIHVASVRGGWVPGTHTVSFDSQDDTIELTHRARSREGFASGALKAASWITDGRKGFFTLDAMLEDVFLGESV
ncbi:MAG: 4-hydroxy-tetrahydrodipicolinate reductase [Sphaerochaeta sp.]|nr:4-hydroxy-tetrahydrodipicolinate reductase [Sphaerochaeta sp.]